MPSYTTRAQLTLITRAKAGAKIRRENTDTAMETLRKVGDRAREERGAARTARCGFCTHD